MSNGKDSSSIFWEGFAKDLSRKLGGYGERLLDEASQERRARKEEAYQIRGERRGEAYQIRGEQRGEASALRMAEKRAEIGFDYDVKLAERKQKIQRDDAMWARRYESSLDQYFGSPQIKERFLRANVDAVTMPDPLRKQMAFLEMNVVDAVLSDVRDRKEIGSEGREILTAFLGNAAAPIFEKIAENKEWRETQTQQRLNWAADRAYKMALARKAEAAAGKLGEKGSVDDYLKFKGDSMKAISDIQEEKEYIKLKEDILAGVVNELDPEYEQWTRYQDRIQLHKDIIERLDSQAMEIHGIAWRGKTETQSPEKISLLEDLISKRIMDEEGKLKIGTFLTKNPQLYDFERQEFNLSAVETLLQEHPEYAPYFEKLGFKKEDTSLEEEGLKLLR